MLILVIKTDAPDAELGLYEDGNKLDYLSYRADRTLAETLHHRIEQLLTDNKRSLKELEGIVCYEGPGSFTGLRIGISLANALSYGLNIPIVGTQTDDWVRVGVDKLLSGDNQGGVQPHYGAEPHITIQKK